LETENEEFLNKISYSFHLKQAKSACEDKDMMLATVSTAAENQNLLTFLEEFIRASSLTNSNEAGHYWIGINRPDPYTSNWFWQIGDNKKCSINSYGERVLNIFPIFLAKN